MIELGSLGYFKNIARIRMGERGQVFRGVSFSLVPLFDVFERDTKRTTTVSFCLFFFGGRGFAKTEQTPM